MKQLSTLITSFIQANDSDYDVFLDTICKYRGSTYIGHQEQSNFNGYKNRKNFRNEIIFALEKATESNLELTSFTIECLEFLLIKEWNFEPLNAYFYEYSNPYGFSRYTNVLKNINLLLINNVLMLSHENVDLRNSYRLEYERIFSILEHDLVNFKNKSL